MYVCCAFVHYVCMYVVHSYNVRYIIICSVFMCMRIYAYVPLCVCVRVHASTSHILTYACCVFVGMRCVYAYLVCSSVCRAFVHTYVLRLYVCMYVCIIIISLFPIIHGAYTTSACYIKSASYIM